MISNHYEVFALTADLISSITSLWCHHPGSMVVWGDQSSQVTGIIDRYTNKDLYLIIGNDNDMFIRNLAWGMFLKFLLLEFLFLRFNQITIFAYVTMYVNLSLTYRGRDKMDAISQTTLANAFLWMRMLEFWLKFHRSLFLRVQLTIFQHWFR